MLSAQCKGANALAWEVSKDDGPFSCPMCNENVLVKKGRVKTHHFAHVPSSSCTYGVGESEAHRRAKVEISEALRTHRSVSKLQLERSLGEVRPDISFCLNGHYVAIEVQISSLSLDTVIRRTQAYAGKGIYLLWVSPLSDMAMAKAGPCCMLAILTLADWTLIEVYETS
jgi:competence protein CoiA